jgi:hypothetical protein
LFIQHTPADDSITAVDGTTGWARVPGRPTNDLSRSDLDAARMDADLQFALYIQQLFPDMRLQYPEMINDHEALRSHGHSRKSTTAIIEQWMACKHHSPGR